MPIEKANGFESQFTIVFAIVNRQKCPLEIHLGRAGEMDAVLAQVQGVFELVERDIHLITFTYEATQLTVPPSV